MNTYFPLIHMLYIVQFTSDSFGIHSLIKFIKSFESTKLHDSIDLYIDSMESLELLFF